MQLQSGAAILLVLASSCHKDDGRSVVPGPYDGGDTRIAVADVIGVYYGRYEYGSYMPFPPPGTSTTFLDTTFLTVYPDTVEPFDSDVIIAGGHHFVLQEDSTLGFSAANTGFSGRFYWEDDTLRLTWWRHQVGDFGDNNHSSFTGAKQH